MNKIQGTLRINTQEKPCGLITITKKSGLNVERKVFPMHSFVGNFWELYMDGLARTSRYFPNIGGGTLLISYSYPLVVNMNAGNDYGGIIVGSGDTAASISDTSLDAHILNGSTTGKLTYAEGTISMISGGKSLSLSRKFTNNSGGTITIKEVGIGVKVNTNPSTTPVLIIRDVLGSNIVLDDTDEIIINAEFGLVEGTNNMIAVLGTLRSTVAETLKNISGQNRTVSTGNSSTNSYRVLSIGDSLGASPYDPTGIQVGSGNTAPLPSDYKLSSRISNGGADGQLVYGSCIISPMVYDAVLNKCSFYIERQFDNSGAIDVTVKEIGLQGNTLKSSSDTFLYHRMVLPEPITIQAGSFEIARFIVEYTM